MDDNIDWPKVTIAPFHIKAVDKPVSVFINGKQVSGPPLKGGALKEYVESLKNRV
jgi:hypothetical protein